jgi:hypothetical protein
LLFMEEFMMEVLNVAPEAHRDFQKGKLLDVSSDERLIEGNRTQD